MNAVVVKVESLQQDGLDNINKLNGIKTEISSNEVDESRSCFPTNSSTTGHDQHSRFDDGMHAKTENVNAVILYKNPKSSKKSLCVIRRLKFHGRSNTGEKLYQCDVCLMSFNRNSTLKSHMTTHTAKKPHK